MGYQPNQPVMYICLFPANNQRIFDRLLACLLPAPNHKPNPVSLCAEKFNLAKTDYQPNQPVVYIVCNWFPATVHLAEKFWWRKKVSIAVNCSVMMGGKWFFRPMMYRNRFTIILHSSLMNQWTMVLGGFFLCWELIKNYKQYFDWLLLID